MDHFLAILSICLSSCLQKKGTKEDGREAINCFFLVNILNFSISGTFGLGDQLWPLAFQHFCRPIGSTIGIASDKGSGVCLRNSLLTPKSHHLFGSQMCFVNLYVAGSKDAIVNKKEDTHPLKTYNLHRGGQTLNMYLQTNKYFLGKA